MPIEAGSECTQAITFPAPTGNRGDDDIGIHARPQFASDIVSGEIWQAEIEQYDFRIELCCDQ